MLQINKISVILPVHNAGKYIRKSIDSVLNQTYTDFELIIIENGSNEQTVDIINSYNDTRIVKIFEKEANLIKALNIGIEKATGQYIARMDADDISDINRFEKQINFLKENNDIDFIGSWCLKIDENDKTIGKYSYPPKTILGVKLFCLILNPFIHPSIMAKAKILKENRYKENYKHVEDYELWSRLLNKYKGLNLPEYLIKYRIHNGSIDNNHILNMRFMSIKIRFLSLLRIFIQKLIY